MKFQKVTIIGAGVMGSGIAHVFGSKDFHTTLIDSDMSNLHKAKGKIESSLDRQIRKGLISESDKSKVLSGIKFENDLNKINPESDLVIEAIYENKAEKIDLFASLEEKINPNAVFASNTSSISITELSAGCRKEKFIGMHFMNPVPVMKLVELIRGHLTSDDTYKSINDLALQLGKVPVLVSDFPGFISNRILMPMINEAVFTLMEGVSTKEDIDTVFKLGMNHPMGPLELADFIGLDVCLNIMNVLYDGFKDSKYRPCPLLVKMVAAGMCGKKTGKGFYTYD